MSGELAKALAEAQKDMPAVDKTGRSNFGAHVTLDHLIAKTRKHLAAHGLSIAQFPCVLDTGQPALRTMLLHASGETLSADAPLFLGEKHTMQALGAALTYARRQGWAAALGISTEDDDDADSISPKEDSAPRKSPQKNETGSNFAAPSGQRTDAQATMLNGLYSRLKTKGLMNEEAFASAAGFEGATAAAAIEQIGKQAASELITKLKTLEDNAKKAAA